jgi:hypothetical protein
MPWAKPVSNEVGLVYAMKFCVFTKIKRKEKKLVVKWDSMEKHASKKKVFNGKWIMDPKCMHIKTEISYVQLFTTIVL